MLNLAFSMVLKMLCLKAVGPRIEWPTGAVAFQHNGHWVSLPSQLSDILLASHEPHLFTIESATQFAKTLKQCDECYLFILNFTNRAAHNGNKVVKLN